MTESKLMQNIKAFLDDLATDAVEERVVEYVIREVRNGRKLTEVLNDPFVKNRLQGDRLDHVLANPEVAVVIEEQISTAFRKREFGFSD